MSAGIFSLVDRRGRKYLTGEERARFLRAVREDPRPAVQTFALALAHTGCRISEALAVRAMDVDLEAGAIRFRTLKRRREHWREVPVPDEVTRALELVHGLRRPQARRRASAARLWTFSRPTASRIISAAMATAGVAGPQACAKGLRHAYGVAAVAAGVPLPTIASVMGHAQLNTTAIYTTAIYTTAIYTTALGAEARDLVARMWR